MTGEEVSSFREGSGCWNFQIGDMDMQAIESRRIVEVNPTESYVEFEFLLQNLWNLFSGRLKHRNMLTGQISYRAQLFIAEDC